MEIFQQLEAIAREREISVPELLSEIEESLATAYQKFIGAKAAVTVHIDPQKGWSALLDKEIVAVVTEPAFQISLEKAREIDPKSVIGDFIQMPVDPNRFGRIAAATFKQTLNQKLREAETRQINEVLREKINDIVQASVSRREGQTVYMQISSIEAELPKREQVPSEAYRLNDRMKVYLLKVEDSGRRARATVSRTHPNLLRKLFETEVPEVNEGLVIIKSVARDPGQRSKIAVASTDVRVDPIGACVGPRGARVQAISDELFDEKIDIVPYSDDPVVYIQNALNPAKVNSIKLNADEKSAYCIVPDNQLSLAIGKGGQNVRLAVRLTEWKIDIRSESQAAGDKKNS